MRSDFDAVIIGAGPSGIFCAYELLRKAPSLRVLVIERGHAIEHRVCPKRRTGVCVHCNPCSITSGFAGAGAFSDGKLSLSPSVGGYLPDILGRDEASKLISESDKIYLSFGADPHVYGVANPQQLESIRSKAAAAGLELVECPIRHLGTEEGGKLYRRMENHLRGAGVSFLFDTAVTDILVEDGKAVGVVTGSGDRYYAPAIVAGVGRVGSAWLSGVCSAHGIDTEVGTVDVGVRVELPNTTVDFLNRELYEAKLKYLTPTYRDKVRTFCTNPGGQVTGEVYDGESDHGERACLQIRREKDGEHELRTAGIATFHEAVQIPHLVRTISSPALRTCSATGRSWYSPSAICDADAGAPLSAFPKTPCIPPWRMLSPAIFRLCFRTASWWTCWK